MRVQDDTPLKTNRRSIGLGSLAMMKFTTIRTTKRAQCNAAYG